jgi:xanthine/CO dehydrogenase XdhC/CoxF family maturation factor
MNRNDWIAHAARLQEAQQAFALVTVLRAQAPTSAKAGDKALVTADGQIHGWIGGGCAQPAVVKTVRQALADGQPQTIRIAPTDTTAERTLGDVLEFGMACHSGGTLELFIDPVLRRSSPCSAIRPWRARWPAWRRASACAWPWWPRAPVRLTTRTQLRCWTATMCPACVSSWPAAATPWSPHRAGATCKA